eukprot:1809781-Amphidinium_carterae.1
MSSPMTLSGIPRDLITGRIQRILAIRVWNLSLPVCHLKGQKLIVMLKAPLNTKTSKVVVAHHSAMFFTKVVSALRVIVPTWLQELVVGITCSTSVT